MLTLSIFIFVMFLLYCGSMCITFRQIPSSLSNTYYLLGKGGPLFTCMMFMLSLSSGVCMIHSTPDEWQFLAFIAVSAIAFVGAAPNFKERFEEKVHTVSAYVAAVFAILWCIACDTYPLFLITVPLCLFWAIVTRSLKSSITWWSEMVAFLTVLCSMIELNG